MLNILEALRSTGHEVSLLTSYPRGLWESAKFFEKPVPSVDVRFIKVPSFLKHPYTIAYVARKTAGVGSDAYDAYKARTALGVYQVLKHTRPPPWIRTFYALLPIAAPLLALAGEDGKAWMRGIRRAVSMILTGA